jgi:hypothetical protein
MLTIDEFQSLLKKSVPPGTIWPNPGGGSTKIKSYSEHQVQYIRGESTISVNIMDLFASYIEFRGKRVSSRDLRNYAPGVFDSAARPAGHSCNCTFLFVVLTKLGLADGVRGAGKAHQPFNSTFR